MFQISLLSGQAFLEKFVLTVLGIRASAEIVIEDGGQSGGRTLKVFQGKVLMSLRTKR